MNTWVKRKRYLEQNNLTYAEYLKSEHWRDLRKRKLASKMKYRCYGCGVNEGLELHHKTYKRMGQEWLMDVIWLCRGCHQNVHTYEREHRGDRRVNLWQASKNIARRI